MGKVNFHFMSIISNNAILFTVSKEGAASCTVNIVSECETKVKEKKRSRKSCSTLRVV